MPFDFSGRYLPAEEVPGANEGSTREDDKESGIDKIPGHEMELGDSTVSGWRRSRRWRNCHS